jgi:hypothetical protein
VDPAEGSKVTSAAPGIEQTRVFPDRVEKTWDGELIGVAPKLNHLAEIGARHGFRSPRALWIDSDRGVVVMERVVTGTSYMDLLASSRGESREPVADAFAAAGRVLGCIHRELTVEDAPEIAVPDGLLPFLGAPIVRCLEEEAERGSVIGHGDFGTTNLYLDQVVEPPVSVVLDPFPNGYSSHNIVVRESRYIDLAVMESCFSGRGPISAFLLRSPHRVELARRRFLDAYERAADRSLDYDLLRAVTNSVLTSYFVRRRGWPVRAAQLVPHLVRARQGLWPKRGMS